MMATATLTSPALDESQAKLGALATERRDVDGEISSLENEINQYHAGDSTPGQDAVTRAAKAMLGDDDEVSVVASIANIREQLGELRERRAVLSRAMELVSATIDDEKAKHARELAVTLAPRQRQLVRAAARHAAAFRLAHSLEFELRTNNGTYDVPLRPATMTRASSVPLQAAPNWGAGGLDGWLREAVENEFFTAAEFQTWENEARKELEV